MAKLEIKENKKLVLKKVICKKLLGAQLDNVDNEIEKFHQHLQLLNVQLFGPLVVKNSGTKIHEDGQLTTDFELYVQAHDFRQYNKIYEVAEEISVPHCLYLRFEDSPEYLQLAYSKMGNVAFTSLGMVGKIKLLKKSFFSVLTFLCFWQIEFLPIAWTTQNIHMF